MRKLFSASREDRAALRRQVPEFTEIMRRTEPPSFEYSGNLFDALVQSVVGQQLAVRAADAVFRRVRNLLGEISADRLMAADPDSLRSCGLSARKTEYLRGIAAAVLSRAIDFDSLPRKSDAEIIRELTRLKGVGTWTAEMLLIFALGRPDVLSGGDLGIRRGIMMLTNRGSLSPEEFESFRRRCSPYGTLASLYLWRIKDGGLKTDAGQKPR